MASGTASATDPADAADAPDAPVPSRETLPAVANPAVSGGPEVADTPPEAAGPAEREATPTTSALATAPVGLADPVAALVGGALAKAAQDAPVAQAAEDGTAEVGTVAAGAAVPAAPADVKQDPPAVVPDSSVTEPAAAPVDPVAALVSDALRKATAEAERAPKPAGAAEPVSPEAQEPTSPPDDTKLKAKKSFKKAGFFGRMFGTSKDSGKDKEEEKVPESTASFGESKDGFGSPVASGLASPEELSSPDAEKGKKAETGEEENAPTDSGAGSAAASTVPPVPEGGEAPAAAAEPDPAGVDAPAAIAPTPATAAASTPPAAAAAAPAPAAATPPRKMTAAEKQASANIVALLQGKPAASAAGIAKPPAPRTLSRADALSLRVHASSALVPNAAVISPVVRIHLVDPDSGSPVRPSGEATTPLQTAPFDLTRRQSATFAARWEETLEVEEALGDVLGARAVVLFEVLQLPPSFAYYEERSGSFPEGQPMRLAWGFLKLLRGSDGRPNMGRLKVQLYQWDDRVGALGLGGGAAVAAAPDAPAAFKEWKRALQVAPSSRRLYPAHLDVTVASSPRTDVVASLLSAPRPGADAPPLAVAAAPAARKSLSGVGDDADAPRPTRRERIDRERAMGGGWRNAESRLARAHDSDREEVVEKLGRLPHETLCYGVNPKAAAAARDARTAAEAEAATPGLSGSTAWKAMAAKRSVVKLPHARAKQEECLIPNADARTQPHLPATASEATLASFDPMGRRLAVVSREGAMYAVRVFDASTGALIAAFPGHASTVYDVQWAPERAGSPHAAGDALGTVDFAAPATRVLTASADGAARAWRVPAMGEDAAGEAAASPASYDIVAQHACGCYSAAWHPTAPGVLATGARDGGVRLWASEAGAGDGGARRARVIASAASAPGVAATAMTFDRTGLRLWVAFADGVVREHRVDVGSPGSAGEGAGPSVRSLRECKDLQGEPITCLRAAPTDRRLFARTVADRVVAVDVSFFAATHTFDCDGGARGTFSRAIRGGGGGRVLRSAEGAFAGSSGAASAGRPLARFALSPDGRWMVAGAADGSARLFDVDVGGVGVMLPAASATPGVRVNDIAWSPAAHCVAVCAGGGARPLRLAAHAAQAQAVAPPPRPKRLLALSDSEANSSRSGKPHPRAVAAMKQQREAAGFGEDANAARRPKLPAKLTPEAVREMLAKVRVESAAQRRGALEGVRRARAAEVNAAGGVSGANGVGGAYGGAVPHGDGVNAGGFEAPVARGGAPAPPSAARAEIAEWQKENAPVPAPAVPAPALAAAPAFPSFDPYGGSIGGGLAPEVGAGAQPRAPAGPY